MTKELQINRIKTLDYLRGLAALGITVYHYSSWTLNQKFGAETIIQRIGIFGVTVFYILSGLTLYINYSAKFNSLLDLKIFFIKRIFRIFPLLWFATILTIFTISRYEVPTGWTIALNLSGLFGFIAWDQAIGIGAWSIGNELVFYAIFPLLMFIFKSRKPYFLAVTFIFFIIYIHFAYIILNPNRSLTTQWDNYVNPLNQMFLFIIGILIGMHFRFQTLSTNLCLLILSISSLLFVLLPIDGDSIKLVTGTIRVAFTIICTLICISFFKISFHVPTIIDRGLSKLGDSSYSLYLLHPIINFITMNFLHLLDPLIYINFSIKVLISFFLSIQLSYLSFILLERNFQKIGKLIASNLLEKTLK